MKHLIDPQHPWFDKAWARCLTAGGPVLWSVVEFYNRQIFWGAAFLIAGLYAAYMLFIVRTPGK